MLKLIKNISKGVVVFFSVAAIAFIFKTSVEAKNFNLSNKFLVPLPKSASVYPVHSE